MPHFVVDCSESILESHDETTINEQIYTVANSTELFVESEIKVKINPLTNYVVGSKKEDFIHVFAYVMEGQCTGGVGTDDQVLPCQWLRVKLQFMPVDILYTCVEGLCRN